MSSTNLHTLPDHGAVPHTRRKSPVTSVTDVPPPSGHSRDQPTILKKFRPQDSISLDDVDEIKRGIACVEIIVRSRCVRAAANIWEEEDGLECRQHPGLLDRLVCKNAIRRWASQDWRPRCPRRWPLFPEVRAAKVARICAHEGRTVCPVRRQGETSAGDVCPRHLSSSQKIWCTLSLAQPTRANSCGPRGSRCGSRSGLGRATTT